MSAMCKLDGINGQLGCLKCHPKRLCCLNTYLRMANNALLMARTKVISTRICSKDIAPAANELISIDRRRDLPWYNKNAKTLHTEGKVTKNQDALNRDKDLNVEWVRILNV